MTHVATAAGLIALDGATDRAFEGEEVVALAGEGAGRWAIVGGSEVWRRLDEEWTRVAHVPERRAACLLPIADGAFVGTSEAHLMRIDGGETRLVEAFDAAEGRTEWYTPWGGPPDVRSLAASPTGAVYANVHVGGILRSDDRGDTWTPTIDIDSDVHEVVAPSDDLVLAATAVGLALSRDRGGTWTFDDEGLHGSYARAVALCGDTVLMTASLGPRGGRAAVYRRPLDATGGFEKSERGLPEWFGDNIDTGCLAASGDTAVFGTRDGEVFASEDRGATWRRIADGLPAINAVAL